MADTKKPYDVLACRGIRRGKDESFINVGVAFEREGGGMSVIIPPGLSVSGRVTIMPRKEKTDAP